MKPIMKKHLWLMGTWAFLSWGSAAAQQLHLQPTPQQCVEAKDSLTFPARFRLELAPSLTGTPTERLLRSLSASDGAGSPFLVTVGVKGDKAVRAYAASVPSVAEGYYLRVEKDRAVIVGHDERGAYYGAQTLAQLKEAGRVPLLSVTDYPDVPFRGVVEGFYGTPWSHEARLSQLDFYGRNKLNVYLYGPKDDPYHSTPHWRKPYPQREAEQLQQLVRRAQENHVLFYWAIHPGQDIRWNEADRDALMAKFEQMYQLGVRAFAIFFDDISGEGTKADKQAALLNYVDDHFVKVKGDVAPLVMCPTEYNKSWSNVEGGYLPTLGDRLNKGIHIMWTGDRVIACVDKASMNFINPLLKRNAYIWWNFPVSDYVRDHLLMGPVYGNGLDIKDDLAAFVSNPMEHPEASKVALYSVADYAWNLEAYDSHASWKRSLRALMPGQADALETFATHNSDLGKNGHRFNREESEEMRPWLERLLGAYVKERRADEPAWRRTREECRNIQRAADLLQASPDNRALVEDIRPWLLQFKLLGEYGEETLNMAEAQLDGRQEAFVDAYTHARALQTLMSEVDATYNQNPYQPGVKTGSKRLLPAFNELFQTATKRFNQATGQALAVATEYLPYTLASDVRQLAQLPVRRRGNTGEVTPSNEVILWQAGGSLTLSLDYARSVSELTVDLGLSGVEAGFSLEVRSAEGEWQSVELRPTGRKTVLQAGVEGRKVTAVRLSNRSGAEQKVYFKQFRLRLAEN